MNDDRQSKIEKRAFEIWQREGCPDGRSAEHWQRADAEIRAEDDAAAKPEKATGEAPGAAPKSGPNAADETPTAKRSQAAPAPAKAPKATKAKADSAGAGEKKKSGKKKK